MTSAAMIALSLLALAVLLVSLWFWHRSNTFKRASELARQVFPVWAEFGPFTSGEESTAAMHKAYLAVFGAEEAERMGEAIAEHSAAFDRDPDAWEENRQLAIKSATSETREIVAIAKGLVAIESLGIQALPSDQIQDGYQWSTNPGAREAHLIRRYDNPYFPESRRVVVHEDLAQAKLMDREDHMLAVRQFEDIIEEISAASPAANVTTGDMLKLRERLDSVIRYSMGIGGPAKEIAEKADRVREAVLADLREAFSGNEDELQKIEYADTFHKDNTRRYFVPVLAQMLREDSPILREETIPTILSEDPGTIAIFISSLPEDSQASVASAGLKLMREALNDGYVDPQFEEKISALKGEWPVLRT